MTLVAGRKRRSAEDGKGQDFARLNVVINHEAYKRLMVNSTMEGLSPGMFLEQLITDHCKAWQMPARGAENPEKPRARRGKKDASVDPADAINRPCDGAEMNQESVAA